MTPVALVVGTSSGFGNLIVRTLAQEGYVVYAAMRGTAGRNADAARDLARLPGVRVLELEVTDEAAVRGVLATVEAQEGRLDVLVNNAGVYSVGLVEEYSNAQWLRVYEVNVLGTLNAVRAALPLMRRQRSGLIVNVSSGAGRVAMPFLSAYTSSKFALEAVSEALRTELAMVSVDVSVVEPGAFPTTNLGAAALAYSPRDATLEGEYGGVARDLPSFFWSMFRPLLDGGTPPDPQLVADAVLDLARRPAGERPFRVVVDPDPASGAVLEQLNTAADAVRRGLLHSMNLGHLYR